ncbi:Elongation of very long chain fatty acids protein [Aphelenchoides bicaudatus]|nr:Elongation of very long chain fatty acids protein [Aphelenchoides bicaudatus]
MDVRGNTSLVAPYKHHFAFPFEQGIPDDEVTQLLVKYWPHTVTVSAVYLALVYSIQWAMSDPKTPPYDLKRQLFLWNGALALFSIFGFLRTSEEFFHTVYNHGYYKSICYSMDTSSVTAHWYLFFALSKFVELGDTIFLVLRKRPLTFLHAYHHCSVMVYTFNAGAEHLACGRWFMWMNLCAHSVMYVYYTVMSTGTKVPRAIAKCVTLVQITQMFLGIIVSMSVFLAKHVLNLPCKQSNTNLYLAFGIYISYAFLFVRFFYQAYSTQPKAKKIE